MLPSIWLRALRPAAAYGLAVAVSLVAGPSPTHAGPMAHPSLVADTTGADGTWSLLYAPKGRGYPGVVRDSRRDRLVMFGGLGGLNTGIAYHDVWTMPLAGPAVWTEIHALGTAPDTRYGQATIYDPVGDRLIVFGGASANGGTLMADVWELSFEPAPQWRLLTPVGAPPDPRYLAAASYDARRGRLLVTGGVAAYVPDGPGRYVCDTWALTLGDSLRWQPLASCLATGPRASAAAVYDSLRDRVVLFGGADGAGRYTEVQTLSLDSATAVWSKLPTRGTSPTRRDDMACGYDSRRDALIFNGGYDNSQARNDTWELSFADSTWSMHGVNGTPPRNRYSQAGFYDPRRDHFVMFGGMGGKNPHNVGLLNEVLSLDLSNFDSWVPRNPPVPPLGRYDAASACDPVAQQLVVFGGAAGGSVFGETWVLPLTGAPEWRQLIPAGMAPSARVQAASFFDVRRDRFLVIGGRTSLNFASAANDVWELRLRPVPVWTQLFPRGTAPSPRFGHSVGYDAVRDRLVLFGGAASDSTALGDMWTLSLGGNLGGDSLAWSQIAPPALAPSARFGCAAVSDTVAGRWVIFGGQHNHQLLPDVWTMTFSDSLTWTPVTPSGESPSPRADAAGLLDPRPRIGVRRMLFFGGSDGPVRDSTGIVNETWSLSLGDTMTWSRLRVDGNPPLPRRGATAVYDRQSDRMIVFAGEQHEAVGDLWALALQPSVAPPPPPFVRPPLEFAPALAWAGPLPARQIPAVAYALLPEWPATIALYTVAGRCTWSRALDPAHGTRGVVSVRPGLHLAAGVYLLQIRQAGTRRTLRAVVLP